jgi:hypothetical protein
LDTVFAAVWLRSADDNRADLGDGLSASDSLPDHDCGAARENDPEDEQ